MSALHIHIENEFVIVGSDTMCYQYYGDDIKFVKDCDKIQYYPRMQSMVAMAGFQRNVRDLRDFVETHRCGIDVDSFSNAIYEDFRNQLDLKNYNVNLNEKMDNNLICWLYVIGFSEKKQHLVTYKIDIFRDKSVIKIVDAGTTISHPKVLDLNFANRNFNDLETDIIGLKEYMKNNLLQMHREFLNPKTRTVGIGGEYTISSMVAHPYSVQFDKPIRLERGDFVL